MMNKETLESTRQLFEVCKRGGTREQVQALLDQGVDLSIEKDELLGGFEFSDNTPLEEAAENGHVVIVGLLKEHGAEVGNALSLAVGKGALPVVKLLIDDVGKSSRDLPNDLGCLLGLAAEKGHLDVAKFLVKSGANVNWRDEGDYTPIMLAAEQGHSDIVKYLLTLSPSLQGVGEVLNELEEEVADQAFFGNLFGVEEADVNAQKLMVSALKQAYREYCVERVFAGVFSEIRGFFETSKPAALRGELCSEKGDIPGPLMSYVISFIVGGKAVMGVVEEGRKELPSATFVNNQLSYETRDVVADAKEASTTVPHYMFPTIASLLKDVNMTVEDVARAKPSFAQAVNDSMVSACIRGR